MNWARRLMGGLLGRAGTSSARGKRAGALRARRVTVEPLEERRLLSVDYGLTPVNTGGVSWWSLPSDENPVEFNSALYFEASGELWKMDASESVSLVADINEGIDPSHPNEFTALGDKLYFSADDGVHGRELWSVDLSGNVSMVADVFVGPTSSAPQELTVFNGELYFATTYRDGETGLWKLDTSGQPALVVEYAGYNSMHDSWSEDRLTPVGSFLYFREPNLSESHATPRLQRLGGSGELQDLGAVYPRFQICDIDGSAFLITDDPYPRLGMWEIGATGERELVTTFGFESEVAFEIREPVVVAGTVYVPVVTDFGYETLHLWRVSPDGTATKIVEFAENRDLEFNGMIVWNDRLYFAGYSGALYSIGVGDTTPVEVAHVPTLETVGDFVKFNDHLYFGDSAGVYKIAAPALDFGDAPDTYGTSVAASGAQHLIGGPTLGSTRDAELDGQPSAEANGDDLNGTDDEDGVTFASSMFVTSATVNVQNAPDGAKLDAWIDFNGDGSFDGPGEQIAASRDVVEGDNLISYVIPDETIAGETYARFRLSSAGGLSPSGPAAEGEVEDDVVTIIPVDTPHYHSTESIGVGHGVVTEGNAFAEVGDNYIVRGSKVYYRQGNDWYVTDVSNVEIPVEEKYQVLQEGDTLFIQHLIEGEWVTEAEWTLPDDPDRFDIWKAIVDGDTIAVQARDLVAPEPEDDVSYVYIIELVDGGWHNTYTIERAHIDHLEFKNGTLGISEVGYYYTPSGWTSHELLSVGYVGLYRKHEGAWTSSRFLAERFDPGSHTIPDWDDGFGTGVFVGGTRVVGTGEEYSLDFRWNESTGEWSTSELPDDDSLSFVKLDGDVLVYGEVGSSDVIISTRAGENVAPFEGDVAFVAANDDVTLLGVAGSDQVNWYDLNLESETEEFQVPVKEDGEITVSTAGEIIPTIEIYDRTGQLVAESATGVLTYVASAAGTYTVKTTAQTDQWVSYDVSILSELPDSVDLGQVDFTELPDVNVAEGAKAYSFTTKHDGYLSVGVRPRSLSTELLTLELLDSDGNPVGESTNSPDGPRIDLTNVTAGETYTLVATGTMTSVDLVICNLVETDGTAVTVHGSELDDQFVYEPGDEHALTVNEISYTFDPADVNSIHFACAGGDDTVTITGTEGNETASFQPGGGSMTTTATGFTVSAENARNVTLDGGGGHDVLEVIDGEGDDFFAMSPNHVMLATPESGLNLPAFEATFFAEMHTYAKQGGNDTIKMSGSADTDRVKIYPELVKMMKGDYYNRAKFFEDVELDTATGADRAVITASDGVDVLWAMKNDARIAHDVTLEEGQTPDFENMTYGVNLLGCENVVARGRGGDDWLELHDSALNDVLIAKPQRTDMMNAPRDGVARGAEYQITTRGFRNVSAIADQGGDKDAAKLYDSGEDGIDIWAAAYVDGQTWSSMTSPTRLLYEVLAFEQVGGYGFNAGLGENHGTNRREHADDVDFIFTYGYWEGYVEPEPEPVPVSTPTTSRPWGRGEYSGR